MDNQKNSGGRSSGGMEKTVNFLVGKGFYIVLFLCLAAIGISGYVILFSGSSQIDPGLSDIPDPGLAATVEFSTASAPAVSSPPQSEVKTLPSERDVGLETKIPAKTTARPAQTTAPSTPPETTSSAPAETAVQTPAKLFYVAPVEGDIIRLFSGDVPVFNPTMGDWRVHSGVDFAAPVGTEVCAVANGTISAVYTDEFKGVCVEMEHMDGMTSLYCGLESHVPVSVGDSLRAGEVLGTVGTSAQFELSDGPHLHFELRENGVAAEPFDHLPGSSN